MKRFIVLASFVGASVFLSSCATKNASQTGNVPVYRAPVAVTPPPTASPAAALTPATPLAPATPVASVNWPVAFSSGTNTYTIFEPQSDSWDGHKLMARSAAAVQFAGQPQPTYGVISFNAITLVDKTTRMATLAEIKIDIGEFPTAGGEAQNYLAMFRQEFSRRAQPLSLDRLESSMAIAEQRPASDRLNNTPPKIIVSTKPAVLVYVNGTPAWRAVPGTSLERVINTHVLLLKDASGKCYLHLFDGYLQAPSIDGPWTVASQPPAGAETAEKETSNAGPTDLLAGEPDPSTQKLPTLNAGSPPDVFVTTTPAELITFGGQPEFAPIPGTGLLYASNTSGNVFKWLADQQNYVLLAGRWYSAPSLNGPWRFVPGSQLPKDFANIPDASPKENVKASVPGTPQASEALIANSIPQSTAVARNAQMPQPQLDGAMQLAPIEGTPLKYVVNSSAPIIQVDPQSWYSCQNGVWYAATSAQGPWTAAASVPSVIYTIPSTSPLHYLTYVKVYGASPDQIYEGYTPGYLGTEVTDDGTVVYGTGYAYTPWIGSVWYAPPLTWGWGFADCWTPWYGWGFDCGFGWGWGVGLHGGWGCFPPRPGWCGYRHGHDHGGDGWRNHHDHGANTAGNFYHHGSFGGNGAIGPGRQETRGTPGYGQAYNSRTGQLAAGQRAEVRNVSGTAWHPTSTPSLNRNSPANLNHGSAGINRSGVLGNNGGLITGSRSANAAGSWSMPRSSYSAVPSRNVAPPIRTSPNQRVAPSFNGYQNRSSGAWRSGSSFNAPSRNPGYSHNFGSSFRGGGGNFNSGLGGSRGGFGGYHGGGAAGGFHAGGGGFSGGGHSGGGGGHR